LGLTEQRGFYPSADEATVRAIALADENVQKFVGGKPVRKVVFVPGKLVNLVA
jgi:leucyl-tRNA synthetase